MSQPKTKRRGPKAKHEGSAPTPKEREDWILDVVLRNGEVGLAAVRSRFDDPHAQNSLSALVRRGELSQIPGKKGIYVLPSSLVFRHEPYATRRRTKLRVKMAMAHIVATRYCPADCRLGLDAGTSCTAVMEHMMAKEFGGHVFTSNLHAAVLLTGSHSPRTVRLKSGTIVREYAAIGGEMSQTEKNWRIDVAVIGVSGVFPMMKRKTITGLGLATREPTQHPFKAWLAQAPRVIIVATCDKVGNSDPIEVGTPFATLSRNEVKKREVILVTDKANKQDAIGQLENLRVRVDIVRS